MFLCLMCFVVCFVLLFSQSLLVGDELSKLSMGEGPTLADHVAFTIGQ